MRFLIFILNSYSIHLLPPVPHTKFICFITPPLKNSTKINHSSIQDIILFYIFFSHITKSKRKESFLTFNSISCSYIFQYFLHFISNEVHAVLHLNSFLQIHSVAVLHTTQLPPNYQDSMSGYLRSSGFSYSLLHALQESPPEFLRSLFRT